MATISANKENVNELVEFILDDPDSEVIRMTLAGHTVPARKAAAWVQHVAMMARRFCLAYGLPQSHYSVIDILITAGTLELHYAKRHDVKQTPTED